MTEKKFKDIFVSLFYLMARYDRFTERNFKDIFVCLFYLMARYESLDEIFKSHFSQSIKRVNAYFWVFIRLGDAY